jgi:site-specific recombinase XerD
MEQKKVHVVIIRKGWLSQQESVQMEAHMSKITFSQATEGYLLAAGARHLSEHTIRDYLNTFKKFSNFLDEDLSIEEITRHHVEAFLAAQTKVTNKTLLNYHVGLSALWTWAVSEHIVPNYVVWENIRLK